jgi:hypothetical protein
VDDGAALLFAGSEMVEAVSARADAGVWHVQENAGKAVVTAVDTITLAAPEREPAALLSIAEFREAGQRSRSTRGMERVAGRRGRRA